MKRIMTPLSQMGADIISLNGNGCAPLKISGKKLHAIHYNSPVASAQVKSCVLLAGMYSDGITRVTEPVLSRNHTEIMLNYFGADVTSEGTTAPSNRIHLFTDVSSWFRGISLLQLILSQLVFLFPTVRSF